MPMRPLRRPRQPCFPAVASAVFDGKRLYFRDRGDPATVRLAQRYGADIVETSADATHVVALERPTAAYASNTAL